MAAINDLINKIEDPELRRRIEEELKRLLKQKKFGLVFEDHIPEGLTDSPIYPTLEMQDEVRNAPDSDLWHALIEADNYYALQLLAYLYPGMVDCIYIDPPYNSGARDWKYNNDYVDTSDQYRHSKWLSMMKRRLKLAKKLLNPRDSVLIVTIDEKEYLHLGCLLEEMFPEARMQMVSCVTNHGGVARESEFSRTDEYIYVVMIGTSSPQALPLNDEWLGNVKNTTKNKLRWRELRRMGSHKTREERPNLFFPIFVNDDGKSIHSVGEAFFGQNLEEVQAPQGTRVIWPLFPNGKEGCWQLQPSTLREYINDGFVRLGGFSNVGMAISYIASGEQEKVKGGKFEIISHREDGSIIVDDSDYKASYIPGTAWSISKHNATEYGTKMLSGLFHNKRFDFPKSLYAVHDTIRFFVANKPNALIVDFFAGSGTTLHAVNLLNAEDGGHRRCIMVTNNEVSEKEAKTLTKQGYKPGDDEWERLGIARYVNWPRTVCSIEGHDVNGEPLKGEYLGTDHRQMSDGFESNCIFFKLNFLDKKKVAMDLQFKELIAILWMKSGAVGDCPAIDEKELEDYYIFPRNRMAILREEESFVQFKREMDKGEDIPTIYIVTDSESDFREMSTEFAGKRCYQLYRDYLDNFSINYNRNQER